MWYQNIRSGLFGFCHKARVCQTDGLTDRQTDKITTANTAR